MGFRTCVLMIRGDHRAALPAVFERFHYQVKAGPVRVGTWNQVVEALAGPRQAGDEKSPLMLPKGACLVNGWTVILDPEMIMSADEDLCAGLSRQLRSRVFTMYCESTTGTYTYGFFDGSLLRFVASVDGTADVDKGPKQPEEEDIADLGDLSDEDVLGVMQRTGVDYFEDLMAADEYYLYSLVAAGADKKPWWRFWR